MLNLFHTLVFVANKCRRKFNPLKNESRFKIFTPFISKVLQVLYSSIIYNYLIRYKNKYRKSSKNAVCEVISIVSHKDLIMYLVAISTFMYFVRRSVLITVFDDGSLINEDTLLLKRLIPEIRIVKKSDCDTKIKKIIKDKLIIKYRDYSPIIRKVIDLHILSVKRKLIYLDSDIIFFRIPTEIIKWIDVGKDDLFFMNDPFDAYSLSNVEIMHITNIKLIPKMNIGLMGFYKDVVDLKLLSDIFSFFDNNTFDRTIKVLDQTIFSVWFSAANKYEKIRLNKQYLVTVDKHVIRDVICRHYFSVPGIRELFYKDALYALNKMSE